MSFWHGVSAQNSTDSVRDDWRALLPDDRQRQFDAVSGRWEELYAMLSVTLDEAMALRDAGTLVRAREQTAMAADLTDRLVGELLSTLLVRRAEAWRTESLPAVQPLRPQNFRGETSRGHAATNLLLHRILPWRRLRFAMKVRKLEAAAHHLADEFRAPAEEIAEGACVEPPAGWLALEVAHDDLTTVLRESTVVLKSYLRAISDRRFAAFCERMASGGRRIMLRARPGFSRVSP